MKILFVMPTHISVGGIESVAIHLWKGLTQSGHKVDFVCHGKTKGTLEKELIDLGANIYHIPIKSRNYFGTIYSFKKILQKGNYDVVHSHMNATSGIYLKIAQKMGVRVLVAHSHASTMDSFTQNVLKAYINEKSKKKTNQYSNIKIACSKQAGEWLFGAEPFHVVLNAVDVNQYRFSESVRKRKRKELDIDEDVFVIIHVGNFYKVKNHAYVIRMFSQIKKVRSKVRLILVGEGPLRQEITNLISALGVQSEVYMLGQRRDVAELLQTADVFVLPSLSEGNPVALVEAATSGLHCLVSDTVATDTAKYFETGAIEYLPIAEDSIDLWVDRVLSSWTRVRYCKENPCPLNVQTMAENVEKLYKEMLEC